MIGSRRLLLVCFVLGLMLLACPANGAQAASPLPAAGPSLDIESVLPDLGVALDQLGTGATCEDACKARVHEAMRRCRAAGGTEERCTAMGRQLHRDCLAKCKRAETCEQACQNRVHMAIRQCIAKGGTQERCEARGREQYRECLAGCKKPARCEDACLTHAQTAIRQCLGAGGSKERCAARGRQVHRECLARCDRLSPKPEE